MKAFARITTSADTYATETLNPKRECGAPVEIHAEEIAQLERRMARLLAERVIPS